RLYDPDEGRIVLDGVDLRESGLSSLRKNIGVIFQDFGRYDFVLKENIGVSQVEALEDDARVREAGRRSLADSVASRLANGYDQMLGRRFDGGVELSAGVWQKVALRRAYLRAAQVLLVDCHDAIARARGRGPRGRRAASGAAPAEERSDGRRDLPVESEYEHRVRRGVDDAPALAQGARALQAAGAAGGIAPGHTGQRLPQQ